jgi:hypothetical protein
MFNDSQSERTGYYLSAGRAEAIIMYLGTEHILLGILKDGGGCYHRPATLVSISSNSSKVGAIS